MEEANQIITTPTNTLQKGYPPARGTGVPCENCITKSHDPYSVAAIATHVKEHPYQTILIVGFCAPVALHAIGFGPLGVIKGSWAATIQSTIHNCPLLMQYFGFLQSIAMNPTKIKTLVKNFEDLTKIYKEVRYLLVHPRFSQVRDLAISYAMTGASYTAHATQGATKVVAGHVVHVAKGAARAASVYGPKAVHATKEIGSHAVHATKEVAQTTAGSISSAASQVATSHATQVTINAAKATASASVSAVTGVARAASGAVTGAAVGAASAMQRGYSWAIGGGKEEAKPCVD